MNTQDEAIIEAVQNAIDGALPGEDAKEAIRAYLSALDKAGWVVTQAEATDHMAVVAMNAWSDLEHMKDQRERMRHAVSQGIAASPPPPGADK